MNSTNHQDLDPAQIPTHVGIILDGNGRWAASRGLSRSQGHQAGEEALFDTIKGAQEIGIEWLTVFVFSTENWRREQEEVDFLMWFNQDLLLRQRDRLHRDQVRVFFIGDRDDPRIPERNRRLLTETEQLTAENRAMNLVFAFNYGGRMELTQAITKLADQVLAGDLTPAEISEETVADHLYLPQLPDLDLLIRTSGEYRISNFLLWQSAYAELYFTETLWPDFDREELFRSVLVYQQRHRRFGGTT